MKRSASKLLLARTWAPIGDDHGPPIGGKVHGGIKRCGKEGPKALQKMSKMIGEGKEEVVVREKRFF